MELDTITNVVYKEIIDIITSKKVQVDDAMTLVAYGVKLMNEAKGMDNKKKIDILMVVFERIAKGTDGQFGTSDDVIPEKVWTQMQTLMQAGMMSSAISVVDSLVNGQLPTLPQLDEVAKTTTCCVSIITKLPKLCIKK